MTDDGDQSEEGDGKGEYDVDESTLEVKSLQVSLASLKGFTSNKSLKV